MRSYLAALTLLAACAGSTPDEAPVVYPMEQRTLPGCLAAYPDVGVSAAKCRPFGPALEYMATGCDNGTYFTRSEDGSRDAFSEGRYIATFGEVVDGVAEAWFIDGASGTCDFRTGELTIWD